MYNPYVIGKKVYMRHPIEEDVEGKWHEWFSDEETTKYLVERYWPNSKERQYEFFKNIISDKDRLVLSIIDIETDKHIGVGNLNAINWVHGYCYLAVVIGEKEFKKGAYAFECFSLILRTAFIRLNLRNVVGSYVNSNVFTEKMLKVLGFQHTGTYKDLYCIDGQFHDCHLNLLKREDWLKRNGFL